MAINLQKGQRISLTKEDSKLSKIMVGLGWDPVEQTRGGILGLLFGSSAPQIDCDASVIMLNENNKAEEIVYFGKLKDSSSSVMHMGDNLTGEGDGDDEQILVELSKVPQKISKLVFVVNIYDCRKRNQHFGMIKNAFIRILDMQNNKELLRFNLSEDYSNKTGIYAGEIYRHNGEWKFVAIGEGDDVAGLKEMLDKYR